MIGAYIMYIYSHLPIVIGASKHLNFACGRGLTARAYGQTSCNYTGESCIWSGISLTFHPVSLTSRLNLAQRRPPAKRNILLMATIPVGIHREVLKFIKKVSKANSVYGQSLSGAPGPFLQRQALPPIIPPIFSELHWIQTLTAPLLEQADEIDADDAKDDDDDDDDDSDGNVDEDEDEEDGLEVGQVGPLAVPHHAYLSIEDATTVAGAGGGVGRNWA
jgi:hypothetical protein